MTVSNETFKTNRTAEAFFYKEVVGALASLCLAGADAKDPLASPLYADLSGLPPTCIQVGGDETLLGESLQLEQNARAAGVDVQAEVFPGQQHTFQMAAGYAPESDDAIRKLAGWVRPKLGLTPPQTAGGIAIRIRVGIVDSECLYKEEVHADRFRVTQVWVSDHYRWQRTRCSTPPSSHRRSAHSIRTSRRSTHAQRSNSPCRPWCAQRADRRDQLHRRHRRGQTPSPTIPTPDPEQTQPRSGGTSPRTPVPPAHRDRPGHFAACLGWFIPAGRFPGLVATGGALTFAAAAVLAAAGIPPQQAGLAAGVMNTALELAPPPAWPRW